MTTMQHLDEQTLAYYAMGADFLEARRVEIEDHLRSCAGCRAEVEELRSINELVAERSTEPGTPSPYSIEAVGRAAQTAYRMHASPSRRTHRHMVTRLQRAAWIVRSHPVVSGAGALLCGFAVFALVMQFNAHRVRAGQPAALRLNSASTALIVANVEGETLCEIPINTERSPESDERDLKYNTRFFDIDGDGRMEIVSTSPYEEGPVVRKNVVRTFTADGRLIHTSTFGMPVTFRGTRYINSYTALGLLIRTHAGRTEFLVSINNYRSPSCLVRMDRDGTIIGEYWHFGWINNPTAVRLPDMDHDAIMLVGGDDSHDLDGTVSGSIALLDPDRIVGRAESSVTRGFGFPPSPAELMYVRTGHPDPALLDTVMIRHVRFKPLARFGEDGTITVCSKGLTETPYYSLLYTFQPGFGSPTVFASDLDRSLLADRFLVNGSREGIQEFYRHMESLVRYWDGRNWQPTPIRITLPQPAS